LSPRKKIAAWDVARAVFAVHPEYGGGLAKSAMLAQGPASATLRTPNEWLDVVNGVVTVGEIHGRLLVLSLCRVDTQLADYLDGLGVRQAIEKEIREPLSEVFRPSNQLLDRAPVQLDSPAERDALGRRGFARALALRIDRIWNEYNNRAHAKGSFMVHLHGPWGSGKSSILRLLRSELQERSDVRSRWIVVEFNAWQNQRLDPPWWPYS
jgi:hypothetical protein